MPSSKVSAVTEERKHDLLLEARRARLSWVQSSTPYKYTDSTSEETSSQSSKDALSILNLTPVSKHLPTSIPILHSLLDGKSQAEVEDLTKLWRQKIQLQEHKLQSDQLVGALDDHAFVLCYQEILERLSMPESTDIVQGMRRFVRSFHDDFDIQASTSQAREIDTGKMVSSIHKNLASIYSGIASHRSWVGDSTNETKMMLETFIYSKCHDVIMKALWRSKDYALENDESDFGERLMFLQFVNPSHLEIPYFSDGDGLWKEILSKPIMLLQSLDNMYSPAQMLRCILEVYRGVNEALKGVMADGEGAGRMPSADDCLPTIILCMICAKPRILTNLKFLEIFATETQLRGESGYAFTNLYSAAQFIRELNLESAGDADSSRPSLHISAEELKQKIKEFQETIRNDTNLTDDLKDEPVVEPKLEDSQENIDKFVHNPITVPVHVVTAARLRGEDPSKAVSEMLDSVPLSESLDQDSLRNSESGEGTGQRSDKRKQLNALTLPEGFTRSYKFLATDANNIRITDIPALLEEYKMLVKTTEILIMERNTFLNHHHEIEMKKKKDILHLSLAEAEAISIEEDNEKS